MKSMKSFMPWIVGIIVFFITINFGHYVANIIVGPMVCNDGWSSSSIGISGACSHHGGVDNSRNGIIAMISLIISITMGSMISNPEILKKTFSFKRLSKTNSYMTKKAVDLRPKSPYGSKENHRTILLKSGAKIHEVEDLLMRYADD